MPRFLLIPAVLGLACAGVPATAETPDPQIDYSGFLALTANLAKTREVHRLPWPAFTEGARRNDAILLDTRSAAAFAAGHLAGAINLPFSDFTDEKLRAVIGPDANRPIYIYCNNNFADNVAPVALKRAPLALNIPTFINLHGYGYHNVWELAATVNMADPSVNWVSAEG